MEDKSKEDTECGVLVKTWINSTQADGTTKKVTWCDGATDHYCVLTTDNNGRGCKYYTSVELVINIPSEIEGYFNKELLDNLSDGIINAIETGTNN